MPSCHKFLARLGILLLLALGALSALRADERIRIVAANLTSGNGQNYDPGEGNRILQGLKPDIVLVQEFNYLSNSAADLRAWVDMVFGPTYHYMREPSPGQIPNGVVSRYPILASGEWNDANVSNRDFAWARLDIPGDKDLWVISVHLLTTSSSNRNAEASQILNYIAAQGIPASDYVVLGGDFNTDTRTEACIQTLSAYFVTSGPYPVDQAGNGNTNSGRSKPYDWVLADPDFHALRTPVVLGANSFPNGLVFDSRVYTPLPLPVRVGDSGASNMQHMAVVRDFLVPTSTTPTLPSIYSATSAAGVVGQAFNYQIAATNGPTAYAATGLPTGLSLDTATGRISGTPSAAGTWNISLSATNANGTGTATLALTVTAGGGGEGGIGVTLLEENFASLTTGNDASNTGPSGTPLTSIAPNFPTCSLAYSAGGAVKLGNSSTAGSITSRTLDLSAGGGVFTVSFKVKGWTTIEGDILVTATGLPPQTVTYTNTLSGGYVTKTVNFTGGAPNSTVTIATTARRAFIDDVMIATAAGSLPTIAADGSLTAVHTTYGGPSPTPTSFTVQGTALTAGILVAPPAGFEVSQTAAGASGYTPTLTVGSAGTVSPTTVYVRLAAAAPAGDYMGVITCSSPGATSVTVPVAPSSVGLRPLVITALDREKPFGTPFTAGTSAFSVAGLVLGQTIGAVTLTPAGGASTYAAAGFYAITPSNPTGGTFTAANYSISYVQGLLTVTAPGFAAWAAGLDDPSAAGDPDGDGAPNLLEYFQGLDPTAPDASTPWIQHAGSALYFDYRRGKAASDVAGVVEWTNTLSPETAWSEEGVDDELLDEFELYETRRATVPIEPGEAGKFVRLRVSLP